METTIYVELEEGSGVPVFAPVPAEKLSEKYYKILEHHQRDYDCLKFNTGTYVYCLLAKLSVSEDLVPVAYCDIPGEIVKYLLSNR